MSLTLTLYNACDSCTYYICTGDGTALDYYDNSNQTQEQIDSNLTKALQNHKNSYVMETCEHLEDEIIDSCQFCGQEETIKKAIIIARSATGPVLHKAMPDDNLTPGERYKLGLITETELLIFNREWREIESIQMKQRINGAPYESK